MMEVTIRTLLAERAEKAAENAGTVCLPMVKTSNHDDLLR